MKNKKDGLWKGGYFAETLDSEGMKEKMKTFHMNHDEKMDSTAKNAIRKYQPTTKIGMNECVTDVLMKNIFMRIKY